MFPGVILQMTYWYRPDEMSLRLLLFCKFSQSLLNANNKADEYKTCLETFQVSFLVFLPSRSIQYPGRVVSRAGNGFSWRRGFSQLLPGWRSSFFFQTVRLQHVSKKKRIELTETMQFHLPLNGSRTRRRLSSKLVCLPTLLALPRQISTSARSLSLSRISACGCSPVSGRPSRLEPLVSASTSRPSSSASDLPASHGVSS